MADITEITESIVELARQNLPLPSEYPYQFIEYRQEYHIEYSTGIKQIPYYVLFKKNYIGCLCIGWAWLSIK